MTLGEHARAKSDVERYLESQLPDQKVEHLERVGIEHVAGHRHEIWDAHVGGERWWVVTNPTNLYPQVDFKSRDVVLTFHVGLAVRVMTRDQIPIAPEAQELFAAVWRRWEQAAEALAGAEEAEQFQAVGTHLRECLISFAHAIEADELVGEGNERPKSSDVVAWASLFADSIAPGSSNERLRGYLKALVQPTWDYQQQLLHDKSATRLDAEIGVQAVAHLLSSFTASVLRHRQELARCDSCEGYSVAGGVCRRCGWEDPNYEPPTVRPRTDEEIAAALAEPCTPSSDLSTFLTLNDIVD